jgi:hypothetical protein
VASPPVAGGAAACSPPVAGGAAACSPPVAGGAAACSPPVAGGAELLPAPDLLAYIKDGLLIVMALIKTKINREVAVNEILLPFAILYRFTEYRYRGYVLYFFINELTVR